jgi:hypothetical protein
MPLRYHAATVICRRLSRTRGRQIRCQAMPGHQRPPFARQVCAGVSQPARMVRKWENLLGEALSERASLDLINKLKMTP